MRAWRVVSLLKLTICTVRQAIFDMVGQRKIVKRTLLCAFIIDLHVVVYGFLV